jgi:REP element-mobilizing transposase RayT
MQSGAIPAIIRGFKAAVSGRVKRLAGTSAMIIWQRNYYEHVVRDEEDLIRLQEYIVQNPQKWELDQLHPGNPSRW